MHTETCQTIHQTVAGLPLIGPQELDQAPANGIYFMYEKGQHYRSGAEDEARIVAVGSNPTRNHLRQRLHKHFLGSKRVSVFRLYIGTALLKRDGDLVSVEMEWFGNRSSMLEVEQRVTAYLAEHFTVRCIAIENRQLRDSLQKRLLGTLTKCPGCRPVGDWLGLYAMDRAVGKLGLWVSYYESTRQTLDAFGAQVLKDLVAQQWNGSTYGA